MVLLLWALALSQAPARVVPTFNVEPTVDGLRLVTVESGYPQELAALKIGAVSDVLRHGNALYAALGAGGVAVIDLSKPETPRVLGHLAEGRIVHQLSHQGDDMLVLILASREAVAYSLRDPLHPTAAEVSVAPGGEAKPPGHGRVLAVRAGAVAIEGGQNLGFTEGTHVAILSHRRLTAADQLAQQGGMAPQGERTAVVVLTLVDEERSMALLGRGDRAQPGDEVVVTSDPPSASTFFPAAKTFDWRLSLTLQPFYDINSSQAVGVLADALVAYHFSELPLRIEAGLLPGGFAAGAVLQHNPVTAIADVAYSTSYFELGFGSGVFGLASACTGVSCSATISVSPQSGPLLVETLRLGAIDGLSFNWMAAVGALPAEGFQILSMRGELDVALVPRVSLFAGGGGGLGHFYFNTGARTYVNGVGGPGTVILTAGIGGAGITDHAPEALGGPALTLGVELRL